MNRKTVTLERAEDKEGRVGSFGFSVLGGHGTKYPAVVCEVESGGPAHQSKMVQVGDRLLSLNGEELLELTSKDLVQRIRTAPSPSTFTLGEDETLRQQVLALLRKQERRAAAKKALAAAATQGEGEGEGGREQSEHRLNKKSSVASIQGEERRKKIIEVEPSVNIESGQNTDIVQVLDNKIIGRRVDQPVFSPDHINSGGSRENSPFRNYPSSGRFNSPSPSTGSATSSGSPRRQRQRKTLEQQTAISPPRDSGSLQSGLDSVSLQSAGSGGSGRENAEEKGLTNDRIVVTKELNGEVRGMPLSHSYTETLNEEGVPVAVVSSASCEFPLMEGAGDSSSPQEKGGDSSGDQDSGISLQIPSWKGPLMTSHKPRSSLAEEILVNELEQQGIDVMQTSRDRTLPKPSPLLKDATPPPDNLPAIPESPKTPKSPQSDTTSRKNRLVSRSSSKRKSNPYSEAVSLARHLYMLDGYKKSEVAQKLSDPSDFGKMVVKEYLRFFEFEKLSLIESLRQFLSYFSLVGESQERERIMDHFSDRYFECNPGIFASVDVVHGMTVALLLLNTDLHSDHGGQKMSFSQFVNNLQGIGVQLPRDVLRKNYESIRKVPLEWATDEIEEPSESANHTSMATASGSSSNEGSQDTERTYHVTIPGTFVEVEMPGSAPLYKEGFVLRKNIMEGPHKKVARGRRNWKQYYAYLKGFLLYFGQPQGELHLEDTSSAISVCHCLAMGASDYHKKSSVFRVTTSDWQSFLLQASSIMDMQQWIGAINKAAARYSSPPLAAPVSSSSAFQRPTFPLAPTRNTLEQQIEHHEAKMKSLDAESREHQAYKPKGHKVKHSQLQSWFDKYEFLQYEVNRFRIYYASLTSDTIIDYNAPLPSGLVPSPSISTLATSSTDQDSELYKGLTPPHSPVSSRHKFLGKSKNTGSPLLAVTSARNNS